MRQRFRPWHLIALAAVLLAGAGLAWYRYWRPLPTADLIRYLPPNEANVVSLDVAALRRGGFLDMIDRVPVAEEQDYRTFVERTGFDYKRDLDTALLAIQPDQTFAVLQGRFNWDRLTAYAQQQGGTCANGLCRVPGGPDKSRTLSFFALRRNVLALAVSRDPWAANLLTVAHEAAPSRAVSTQPVWVSFSPLHLKDSNELPAGTKLFARALGNAEQIVLSIGPDGNQVAASLDVTCRTPQDATLLTSQLTTVTATLQQWITREKQKPNPHDFSGILTSGTFQQNDRRVKGRWPLEKDFLAALAGGGHS